MFERVLLELFELFQTTWEELEFLLVKSGQSIYPDFMKRQLCISIIKGREDRFVDCSIWIIKYESAMFNGVRPLFLEAALSRVQLRVRLAKKHQRVSVSHGSYVWFDCFEVRNRKIQLDRVNSSNWPIVYSVKWDGAWAFRKNPKSEIHNAGIKKYLALLQHKRENANGISPLMACGL